MLEKFVSYIETEKQYSELTVSSYKRDIGQFLVFIGVGPLAGADDLEQVTYRQLRGYVMDLSERKYGKTSINRKISALRSFFSYLHSHGYISHDPSQKISTLKKDRTLPKFVEQSVMTRMADDLMEVTDDYMAERDSLIVLMLYATGLRVSELIELKNGDISADFSEIKVTGKGSKERLVPLMEPIVKKVKNLIFLRDNICFSRDNYLFLSQTNQRMNRSAVYRVVNSVLARYGVDGKKSPHVLRHTFATHLLNNGAGIETVKELLGHESLATTQIYTHNNIEQLKKSYSRSHPRGTENDKK